MSDHLKLKAENSEDLQVISAITQDAIVRVSDIKFDKDSQTLTLVINRFKQEHKNGKTGERTKSGLRFHNVLALQSMGISRVDPNAFTVLLSVDFKSTRPKPTGELNLIFSGGGQLKAKVEALEARLVDFANPRETKSIPLHPLDE
ncbi:MAG: DUF2948 family protein [Acidimicrobiales bacterium]|nr:DUF2948 family protein [Hyphomonadaceae bacterium]RZV40332.1 MAG: DUF2948 family protein [Acidimicrobiales bacterium]